MGNVDPIRRPGMAGLIRTAAALAVALIAVGSGAACSGSPTSNAGPVVEEPAEGRSDDTSGSAGSDGEDGEDGETDTEDTEGTGESGGPGDSGGTESPGAGESDGTGRQRQVPPLVLPSKPPGTDEAYREMIAELERFITPDQLAAGVPWPDLRQTDPIDAYRSCAEYQSWLLENNPTPPLVDAYTAPDSPERTWDYELLGMYQDRNVVSTPPDPPYQMQVEGVAHPAATDINDALLAQVPDGSVAVVYWDSVGTTALVNPDGEIESMFEGWVDRGPWVAIMAPTEVGWQVWWDELTESNPIGDDDQGGPAVRENPRVQA